MTASEPSTRRSGGTSSPLQIWVLEDDPVDQHLIRAALNNVGDVGPAVMARTGEEMLTLLDKAARPPDLFLVDLNTPGAGGVSLARSLRERDELVTVPIVVLTSSVNRRDHLDAARVGVNAFHVKPFDWRKFNELIAMVVSYWSLVGTDAGRDR